MVVVAIEIVKIEQSDYSIYINRKSMVQTELHQKSHFGMKRKVRYVANKMNKKGSSR